MIRKERRLQVCQDIIERLQTEPDLLRRVITGDETWIWVRPGNQAPELSVGLWRHRGRRNQDNQNQKSKSCWSRSSMSEASSTVSSCHRARRSISKSTTRSCGFCFAHRARRDESSGRTNHGCFTTTVHLSIRQFLAEKNSLPIHLTLLRVPFFFSPSSRRSSRGPVSKAWRPSRGP